MCGIGKYRTSLTAALMIGIGVFLLPGGAPQALGSTSGVIGGGPGYFQIMEPDFGSGGWGLGDSPPATGANNWPRFPTEADIEQAHDRYWDDFDKKHNNPIPLVAQDWCGHSGTYDGSKEFYTPQKVMKIHNPGVLQGGEAMAAAHLLVIEADVLANDCYSSVYYLFQLKYDKDADRFRYVLVAETAFQTPEQATQLGQKALELFRPCVEGWPAEEENKPERPVITVTSRQVEGDRVIIKGTVTSTSPITSKSILRTEGGSGESGYVSLSGESFTAEAPFIRGQGNVFKIIFENQDELGAEQTLAFDGAGNLIGEQTTSAGGDVTVAVPPPGIGAIGRLPGPGSMTQTIAGILGPGLIGILGGLFSGAARGGRPGAGAALPRPGAPPKPGGLERPRGRRRPEPAQSGAAAATSGIERPAKIRLDRPRLPLDKASGRAKDILDFLDRRSQTDKHADIKAIVDKARGQVFGPDGKLNPEKWAATQKELRDAISRHAGVPGKAAPGGEVIEGAKAAAADTYDKTKAGVGGLITGVYEGFKGAGKGLMNPRAFTRGFNDAIGKWLDGVIREDRKAWSEAQGQVGGYPGDPMPMNYVPGLAAIKASLKSQGGREWGMIKEILPVEEAETWTSPHASTEEKLWSIPSAAVKIAGLLVGTKADGARAPGTGTRSLIPSYDAVPVVPKGAPAAAVPGGDKAAADMMARGRSAPDAAAWEKHIFDANKKSGRITDMIKAGEKPQAGDLTKIIDDPTAMTSLKGADRQVRIGVNRSLNKEIYHPANREVVDHLKKLDPTGEYKVETVRSPWKKYRPSDINSDHDIRVVKKVTADGQPAWQEVSSKEWQSVYDRSFAGRTGYTEEALKSRIPKAEWDRLSTPEMKQRKWGELHGQTPGDRLGTDAATDFSDQRTPLLDPGKKAGSRPVMDAVAGKGKLADPQQLAMLEEAKKFKELWHTGDPASQGTALRQLAKGGDLTSQLLDGAAKMDKNVRPLPQNIKDGLAVIRNENLSPLARDAELQRMGFPGGAAELSEKIASNIDGLKLIPKKGA